MADVTLTYKGNTILQLDDSDEKVLNTSGKYLEDNILLSYIKSSGGGGGSSYVENESGTIGVELSDENCRIYFNGFTKTSSDVPIADAIGTANDPNYRSLFTMIDSTDLLYSGNYVLSAAYDSDKTTQIGWIGFYSPDVKYVRSWTMDLTGTLGGTFWGVIDLLNTNAEQNNPYVEPPRQLYTNIIKGTSNPPSSMGSNGNEYLQYVNVRDGSNPITHAYVKVNGSWQNLLSSVIEDVDNTVDFSYNTSIIGGNNEPNSGIGNNGNVYLKYNKQDYPDGYTALDYIGVGNEKGPYIDTGVLVTSTSYFEVVSQYTDYPGANEWVFGTYSPNKDTMYGCYPTVNDLKFLIGGGISYTGILDFNKHTYKADSRGMFIDGVNVGSVSWSNVPASNTYDIFSCLPQYESTSKNVRIFSVKIWDNTTLVRNMIPVKRNSDNEVGMYDLVNGVFYTNSGTGSFVTGKVSANSPIEEAYVKVSNNWQPLVGSDVGDVSNSGMYTGTEAPPPDSLGSDGDYYYQRSNSKWSIESVKATINGSNTTAYGMEFTVNQPLTVTSLFAMTVENRTGKLQLGTTAEILAETESVTFPANKWVEVQLQSPIQLATGVNYVVKADIDTSGYGRVGWVYNSSGLTYDSNFSHVQARYGKTWPGTAESVNCVLVGVSYLASDGVYRIRKQFHKASGSWSEIT